MFFRKLCIAAAVLASTTAFAHEFKAGELVIHHPWSRETMAGMNMGAVYFKIENSGSKSDSLQSVSNPEVAEKMELHTHLNEGGVMKMRPVGEVSILPKATVDFKPQSYHVMMFGVKKQMKKGDKFPVTLHFKEAGDVKVEVYVEAADSMH